MKIEGIDGINFELTPVVEKYMQARIAKLARIVQRMKQVSIHARVGKPTAHRRKGEETFFAELNMMIEEKKFTSNRTDPNIYKAMEKARVDMHQQVMKWKKVKRGEQRKNGAITKRFLRSHDGGEW